MNENVLNSAARTNVVYLSSQCAKYICCHNFSVQTAVISLQACSLYSEISHSFRPNVIIQYIPYMHIWPASLQCKGHRFSYGLVNYLSKRNITTLASCLNCFPFCLCFSCAKASKPVFNLSRSYLSFNLVCLR